MADGYIKPLPRGLLACPVCLDDVYISTTEISRQVMGKSGTVQYVCLNPECRFRYLVTKASVRYFHEHLASKDFVRQPLAERPIEYRNA